MSLLICFVFRVYATLCFVVCLPVCWVWQCSMISCCFCSFFYSNLLSVCTSKFFSMFFSFVCAVCTNILSVNYLSVKQMKWTRKMFATQRRLLFNFFLFVVLLLLLLSGKFLLYWIENCHLNPDTCTQSNTLCVELHAKLYAENRANFTCKLYYS